MDPTKNSSSTFAECTRTTAYLAIDENSGYIVADAAFVTLVTWDEDKFLGYLSPPAQSPSALRREKLNQNPDRRAALDKARRRIADALPEATAFSLAKLRLRAGLSQADLAEKLETQQPAIARLEKGNIDPTYTTIAKLAAALKVDVADICAAIEAGKPKTHGK